MTKIIVSILLSSVSLLLVLLGIRSFMQKGFLFNNAYIYASKDERQTMDKKPHYRQTGIIFVLIGAMFAINGTALLLERNWLYIIVGVLALAAMIYAVASSVMIEKASKQNKN